MDSTRFHLTEDDAVDLVLTSINQDEYFRWIPQDIKAYKLRDLAVTFCNLTGKTWKEIPMVKGEKTHELLDYGMSSFNADKLTGEELRLLVKEFLDRHG